MPAFITVHPVDQGGPRQVRIDAIETYGVAPLTNESRGSMIEMASGRQMYVSETPMEIEALMAGAASGPRMESALAAMTRLSS